METKKIADLAIINELSINQSEAPKLIGYIDISSVDKGQIATPTILEFKDAPSRARRIVRDKDILISTVRPNLRHYAFIKNPKENTVASTGFAVITCKDVNPRYLYYYLTTNWVTDYLSAIAESHTSTYPAYNPDVLENLEIPFPPLDTQKRIAAILGTLDDKIELNRQMNRTLEVMARAIFKSWFVDFDPVYAKMEGRDDPLPAEVMDLFPDELVESELGLIPKGWKVRKLKDGFNFTMGQSPPGSTYNEEGDGLPFYQGRRDFGFRYPALRVYCNEPKRIANPNDTLVSVRAPVGDVNLAKEECCIGRGVAAVRHKTGSASFTYYSMLNLKDYFNLFEAEGTVFGSISKTDFEGLEEVLPSNDLVNAFEDHAGVFDKKIENNSHQVETLSNLREILLPRLMSGEIFL